MLLRMRMRLCVCNNHTQALAAAVFEVDRHVKQAMFGPTHRPTGAFEGPAHKFALRVHDVRRTGEARGGWGSGGCVCVLLSV